MQDFKGKTAVVTGAASGIGRGLAERFVVEGMRVVLADIEEEPLHAVEEMLLERGAEVIAVKADTRKLEQIEELERAAVDAFGKVHILCNNAGVGAGGLTWQTTQADWEWVLGVNLWGVIHGVRTFLPGMLAHGEEGHIVNTASMAGLVAGPFMGPYNVSKYGVVALSETLFHELKMAGGKVGVSVLCPGWVNTRINESGRNRPEDVAAEAAVGDVGPGGTQLQGMMSEKLASGMPPAELAALVLTAVQEQRFYILTHPEMKPAISNRFNAIMDERDPNSPGFV